MTLEYLVGAVLAVNVIGGLILGKWVHALKGTVDAQAATIATMGLVNETVLKVFTALDPERFVREATAYKDLVDRKAAALVEDAERQSQTAREETVQLLHHMYAEALGLALRFVAWVPKRYRAEVVLGIKMPDEVKGSIMEIADNAPDWSGGAPLGGGLSVILAGDPAQRPPLLEGPMAKDEK
jgi:hypothetical protein